MARVVKDRKLDTRDARDGLSEQKEPYWRLIFQGAHIGYYKGGKSSSWVARYRHEGDKGGYKKVTLGKADDFQDNDGVNVLNYREAQHKAQEWFRKQGLIAEGHIDSGKYTVKDAIDDYGRWYRVHRKSWDHVVPQINAHIIPPLGDIEVSKLTARKIINWHSELSETPPRRRSKKNATKQNYGKILDDDARRKRQSTSNRILTILKAALNKAYEDQKVMGDDAWRRVKPFKNVDHPIIDYLNGDEIVRIVNATDSDFRPLVQAALYTGCRYGELINLCVSDYNPDMHKVQIRKSKNGKARAVVLNDEAQIFFEQTVLLNKKSDDLMFSRPDGKVWGKSHQTRRLKDASKNGKIGRSISFHILRHTHASQLAMQSVPMAVIAKQLGNSVKICEKHYAHLSPDYVTDTIREHLPKFGIAGDTNIVKINKKTA
jgi:integrase